MKAPGRCLEEVFQLPVGDLGLLDVEAGPDQDLVGRDVVPGNARGGIPGPRTGRRGLQVGKIERQQRQRLVERCAGADDSAGVGADRLVTDPKADAVSNTRS